MKLEELKSIKEHNTVPHPDKDSVSFAQQQEWLKSSTRTDITSSSPSGPTLSLFRNELDFKHHLLVFTDRQKQDVPIGYAVLVKSGGHWEITDMWIKEEFRGKGLITNLYLGLKNLKYSIISGIALSTQAENVWKSLGQHGLAKVFDSKTGEVKPFDLSPIGDGDNTKGILPRFYWITEGIEQQSVFSRTVRNKEELAEGVKYYLDGITPGGLNSSDPAFKVLGIYTHIIDAEI